MGNYDGERVLVVGGTSGIGLATAKLFVDGGARVAVTGRRKETLDAAREELGANAFAWQSDATSLPAIDALAGRVEAELGVLDLLFVNAGATRFVPFEEMDEAGYDALFAVNAKGPYFTVQKLAPLLTEGSAVVLTTSLADVKGMAQVSVYSAAKAALRSMARTLARELLPRGIRVNAVSPGPIDTSIIARSMPEAAAEQAIEQLREANPMKRLGRPEEVAKAVAFLAFEATFTTGAELTVDGGASQL
ncbi:SDR family oxidoreductase [Streptomyces sp. NPDC003393]